MENEDLQWSRKHCRIGDRVGGVYNAREVIAMLTCILA